MSLALLLAAATATTAGAAALYATRGLRRQITALRADLATATAERAARAEVPAARTAPVAGLSEIRAAVADALAEERERELAEARAFWAAQEALDLGAAPGADAPLLSGLTGPAADETTADGGPYGPHIPRQPDLAGLDLPLAGEPERTDAAESPELAAARRRHPSHPDFSPAAPVTDHERTVERLTELAADGVPLADVRPGPLGTLDVYVFADGTTVCMTPGHRETAENLAHALRTGDAPVLLGGSGVAGAYALTFGCASGNVYVLADRVIASH
ncbi:hypothetical protein I5Q34_14385 [Streptomyces sp. AV19]|uniref:hypothetical protein n=1 Tax=Streptomyces sp. AV19 TaxID=2793068 RepID=UPI0018FEE385|nr:hypothetical protein [Streptomyces sp. AV19]MBH1935446.1 hypothetical protein [Streptomyces sp. AV19]MDG4531332.1 hypothetical protein [Streptomyces sp. AV19]